MNSKTGKPRTQRQRVVKFKSHLRPVSSLRPSPVPTPPPLSQTTSDSSIQRLQDLAETKAIDRESEAYVRNLIWKIFYPSVNCVNYQDILPSLTSSTEVDLQLYASVGLLFRSFIHRWYNRLTDDQEFTTELVAVVAHITRALESRFRAIDLTTLLLDDVPFLLDEHLSHVRQVQRELASLFLPFDTIDKAFDHLNSHPALEDDPESEQRYLRALSNHLTKLLLPPDEVNSQISEKFISSLLSDLLLKSIIDKLSQPYQIFEILTQICQSLLKREDRLEKEKKVLQGTQPLFSMISHIIAYTTSVLSKEGARPKVKVHSLYLFTFLKNLFQIDSYRPLLYATLKSLSLILNNTQINHLLNNILENTLLKNLRSPTLYATIIKVVRINLFPTDEEMGPSRIEPDEAEFEAIRSTTKRSIIEVCNRHSLMSSLLISNSKEELDDVIEGFLTSFESKRVNKHLILKILDLIVLRTLPELTSQEDNQ